LNQYKGTEPFGSFIKKFFSQQKKYGSKDRKQIAHLCYCYFRLGKSLPKIEMVERILAALFLCSTEPNNILADLKPEWNAITHLPINEKISALPNPHFAKATEGKPYSELQTQIFPWSDALSEGINPESFNHSFLIQPNLFLRIRPGNEEVVKRKLLEAGYDEVVRPVPRSFSEGGSQESGVGSPSTLKSGQKWFQLIGANCIALPNGSKIEEFIELDKEAVVQDYSSQQIATFLKLLKPQTTNLKLSIWDCCAASGGKSILAKDVMGDIDLTVSDVRETILMNLQKRFEKAEIKKYESFVSDLSKEVFELNASNYQLIICDVPCTGSGTWSRTPEQLFYFKPSEIEKYKLLQRRIVRNVIHGLVPGGHFLYITCSVFKMENEEMVAYIKEKFHLKLIKMELLKGYDQQADTMYAALFIVSEV
jgi:16S rRNA (cytosine967-C5)-methyltransferase